MVCNVRSIILVLVILTVCKEYTTCNIGYYIQGTTCTQCPGYCTSCTSATDCTACITGYSLHNSLCCPQPCSTCSAHNQCTSCITGYQLHNSLCCPQACSTCSAHNYCTSCKAGYYMDQGECKQCSDRCASCGSNSWCLGCKSGYREMTGSCYICPDDCDTCIGDIKCSSCRYPGNYVFNHACVKCPEKCVSCTSNTECTYCTKGFYGSNQCLQKCSDKCKDRDCELNGQCRSCIDGMHGDNCDIKCGQNCTRCDRNTGGCSSCETGTYLNNNQCERCSATCTQCTSSRCTECVVGHWGGNCEKVCTKCKSGTPCGKNNGYCKQSCVDGMYSSGCITRCSPKCVSCQRSSSSRCTVCVANKYGYNSHFGYYSCNNDCPQNCVNSTCDDKTGECTFGCIEGYHGKKCKCPQNCNCDTLDRCRSCNEGFGNINQNCQCTNENCKANDCSACTSLNYFVLDKTCCSCRVQDTNCEECTTHVNVSFGRCTKCRAGFFPTNKCHACSARCNDIICDPVTGACTLGCYGPNWGLYCENNCSSRCRQCDQQNGTCTVCREGKYLHDCSEACSDSCKINGNFPTCAINDGACTDGCHSTKVHGSHCQHSCSINCTNEQCDWQTAHCLHGCTDHHYGNVCNNICSQTCSTPKTGSRCYDTNGTCVDGCEVGYYGETCENQCSPNCVDIACEQFTGSCQNGCREHYEGNDCMMEVLNNKTDEFGVTTMIVGVGIGLVIAIIIAVGAIVFKAVWKRRIRRLNETGATVRRTEQRAVNVSLTNFPNQTDNIRQRNDDSEVVVYEQIDEETNVHPGKNIVVDDVPVNEDNRKDKLGANVGVEYEQIDEGTHLKEACAEEDYLTMDGATGQGSEYEQLKPRNTDETNYSGLDVQDKDNVTDMSYENMKIK